MCQRIDTCIRIVGCVIGSIEQFTVFVLYLILSMTFVYGTSRCITIAFVCFVKQIIKVLMHLCKRNMSASNI